MVLGVYIAGLIVSIVGIVMKVKVAYITCLLWMMDIAFWILEKMTLNDSIAGVIISFVAILLNLFWIIRVNKIMSEVH